MEEAPLDPVQHPRTPVWRHAVLFVATFATLWLAGSSWWEPGPLAGLTYAVWVVLILGAHEMGHYLACRYYGIPATLPFFIPGPPLMIGTFGAVIRIRGRIPHRRALFDVAAAGPIAGVLLALPALVIGLLRAEPVGPTDLLEGHWEIGEPLGVWLLRAALFPGLAPHETYANAPFGAGWVGLLVTALNLFPVGQLDGGHAVYALSRRWHRVASWTTLGGLLGVMLFQVVVYDQWIPSYLPWFAILLWMRDRHPQLLDETESLGRGRTCVALLLLVIFLLSFTVMPIRLIE